jgi:serine/threonine-protein kinase
MIRVIRICRKCGAKIFSDAPEGLCTGCVLESALGIFPDAVAAGHDCGSLENLQTNNADIAPRAEMQARVAKLLGELGDYELLEEVGRGGQGVVFRARQKSLNRIVALKVIGLGQWATKAHLRRFRLEAEAAASLDHPCIVPIYEVGERDGQCYFSMKFIEGGQLDEVVKHTSMPIRQAAELITKVARTVHYAHEHGILHRDIKPGNILLDAKGEPHLTDFGLARLVESESSVTRTMEVMGTPSYMAPEQAVGNNASVSSATDVYGLGAVLYQLLTGQPPFAGGTTYETIKLLLDTEPRPPRLLNPKVDRDLSTICLKCLEKGRTRRYPSALALAEDLEHWLKHEPIQARRIGAFTRGKKWVRRNPSSAMLAGSLVALAAAVGWNVWKSELISRPIPKGIAVLPFANLSQEPDSAYLAEGIKDEILTNLASVRDLKVISRTSTAKYQSKPHNLKTVAQELGVSTILEGTVQKAGGKVRVNVQLIDARADTHLWAKSYDRDLKDVLGVESELSREIAEALQANLSPSESHGLAAVRTHDAEAYDLFLRGEYEFHQAESSVAAEAYDRANAFYRQALARDPNFAEAAAELARSRLWWHWKFSPLAPPELEEVKLLIDRALALAPNSPEAHFVLGLFSYWGHRQYEMALTEFNRALELQPNNALARQYCAAVYRRRGEWERSLADFQRAQELDPRDTTIATGIGQTYLALRLWEDAERAELRALAIDPHNALAAHLLLSSRLNATGDAGSARRAVDGFPEAIKSLTRGIGIADDLVGIIGISVYLDVMERRFTGAFQAFEKKVVNDDRGYLQQLAGRVALRVLAGEPEAAKSIGEEALPLLEARFRERPDDTFAMTGLSWVYLALGRNADALRLSRQAADTISIEKDAVSGPFFQNGLAQIEARAGAPEEAIKRLRRLLSTPAGQVVSLALLKIDPVWDPIRNRPDFQQLLSGPEQIGPNK